MKDAKTLYQDLIVDHGKTPRNEGKLEGATHEATMKNPLCGDRVTVRARIDADGIVREAKFEARGCMIAKASASLLTEAIVDQSVDACAILVSTVDALVIGDGGGNAEASSLDVLRGAQDFPARRACVTLAWHALDAALKNHKLRGSHDEAAR